MTLRKKYRKYLTGGEMALIQAGQQFQSGMIDNFAPTNEYGNQGAIASALKGNAQLGTIGAVMGYFKGKKQMEQDKYRRLHDSMQQQQQEFNRSAAIISADPALVTGRPGEELYGSGGFLKNKYYDSVKATGGNLKPMSFNSAEVQGPSHEQGGVDIPQFKSELEGGETMQDNYVFSERLGFAQVHKRLAKAIGKIEDKPATPDRINSLRRMNQQVETLKQQQEQIRQQYNLT
jgi:hypothetical protein